MHWFKPIRRFARFMFAPAWSKPWCMGVLLVMLSLAGLWSVSERALAGVERYGYDPLGRLIQHVNEVNQLTEYKYDAAGNLISVTSNTGGASSVPVVSSVTPGFLRRGQQAGLVISGQNLDTVSLRTSDPGLDLSNIRQTPTQIQLDVSVGAQVPVGQQQITLSSAAGSASASFNVGPVLPVLTVEPSPLALPPDNVSRNITIRLSSADLIAHTVNLASTDVSKATVSPAAVTFAAGQTTASVSVTPKVAGFLNLQLTSSTLAGTAVPVFITADFRGISTSYAQSVGVMVGQGSPTPSTSPSLLSASVVGVSVGSVLTNVSPAGTVLGQTTRITVLGRAIPANSTLQVFPADQLTISNTSVASDGSSISADLSSTTAATPGSRKVVIKTAAGVVIPYVDQSLGQIYLATGMPRIDSIDPLFATPGQILNLKVRGQHLQSGVLTLVPALDLAIEPGYTVSSDGKELTARIQVMPAAARGPKVVVVNTPSGSTGVDPTPANQLTIVQENKGIIGPVFALPVGIQVGGSAPPSTTQTLGPVMGKVGVVVGSAVQSISPRIGIGGTRVELVATGMGLQSVTSVGFVEPTGLTASTPTISTDGTRLTVQVDVAPTAPRTLRRVELRTASGRVPFLNDADAGFQVYAPPPVISGITPGIIKAGTTVTLSVTGANLSDIQSVRFLPDSGLQVSGSITPVADGTSLSVTVVADALATTGPRVMVITTAGGETSSVSDSTNTVQVGRVTALMFGNAQPVGVQVGSTTPAPQNQPLTQVAPLVGVLVQTAPQPVSRTDYALAPHVGIVVGTAVTRVNPASPAGFLIGGSGTLTIEGHELQRLTGIQTRPASSLVFGAMSVNPEGTQAQVPVSVPSGQTSGKLALRMSYTLPGGTMTTAAVTGSTGPEVAVGSLPTDIYSVSPIVVEQGKTYTFTVRGANLRDVYQIQTEPTGGLNFAYDGVPVQWSTDTFGEKLTVQLKVDALSAVGSRVIRLQVPGAVTSADASPANTITVVTPP